MAVAAGNRAAGVEGSKLAEVILAWASFGQQMNLPLPATLIGEPSALKERISRLLTPVPADSGAAQRSTHAALLMLGPTLLIALALGSIFGERVVHLLH